MRQGNPRSAGGTMRSRKVLYRFWPNGDPASAYGTGDNVLNRNSSGNITRHRIAMGIRKLRERTCVTTLYPGRMWKSYHKGVKKAYIPGLYWMGEE
jgi:hypothetical protein